MKRVIAIFAFSILLGTSSRANFGVRRVTLREGIPSLEFQIFATAEAFQELWSADPTNQLALGEATEHRNNAGRLDYLLRSSPTDTLLEGNLRAVSRQVASDYYALIALVSDPDNPNVLQNLGAAEAALQDHQQIEDLLGRYL